MARLPIRAEWSTRPGEIHLVFPEPATFSAVVDAHGGHLSVTLTRYEAARAATALRDLLAIAEEGGQQ